MSGGGAFALVLICCCLGLLNSAWAQTGVFTLQLTGGGVRGGQFFSILQTNSVLLSGSNTMAGATRVVVNGDDASFNAAQGTWSKTQALSPGVNDLFIAALDASGNILFATNRYVIAELSSRMVGGALPGSAVWTNGVIHVTSTVTVPAGQTLAIQPGAVVLLASGASIQASGATLIATGAVDNPVYFLPEDVTSEWGELSASGSGGNLVLRQVETAGGRVRIGSSASGTLEDSYFRENYSGSSILSSSGAALVTVRRIHVKNYYDINFNNSLLLAEDSLFEDVYRPSSDAFEMSGAPPGLTVRRVTVRRILGPNSDAIDFNGSRGVLVESCLVHDVSDKGLSIGSACNGCASSFGMTVSNCLIYNATIGLAIKDGSTVGFFNNTIYNCASGASLYKKYAAEGGHITNGFNNILWGNTIAIGLSNSATAVLSYSDIQGSIFPGAGNINADPLFVNPAAQDFHLGPVSPCIGTGLGGGDMGVGFPVGGLPGPPSNLAALVTGTNPVTLVWLDDAENEAGFVVERSTDGALWGALDVVSPNITSYTDLSGVPDQKYYYRVRAANGSGNSRYSNIASGARASLRLTMQFEGNPAPGQAVIQLLASPGVSYTLQYRDSFGPGSGWEKLADVAAGLGGPVSITNIASAGARFYRLVSPQQ